MDEARTAPLTIAPDGDHSPDAGPDGPGAGGPPGRPSPRARRVPSAKPALIVVGIAAFLVLLFGIGGALNSGTSSTPKPATVTGAGLAARPAATVMAPVLLADTPPTDILDALVVPEGSVRSSAEKWDGQTQFSATVHIRVPADQAAVVKFFDTELKGRGWDVLSTGPADHASTSTQVLATRASDDGWYWEVGVTVAPSRFTAGGSTDTTPYSIELYEVQDAT